MEYSEIKQLQIIHLSDLHIGDTNIFSIEKSPSGDIPPVGRVPSIFDKLKEDLTGKVFDTPTILAFTGDLTETGTFKQYQEFETLLDSFLQDEKISKFLTKDKVFIVPGNHDVLYAESDLRSRTHEWVDFMNRFTKKNVDLPKEDQLFPFIDCYDCVDNLGAIIVTLNSSVYVKKDSTDENRGVLGFEQKNYIEKKLEAIPEDRRKGAIKIALVHHHPILYPQLAESMRGYDAIVDSSDFLGTLQSNGFHMILHGHKHNPFVFACDTRSAFEELVIRPMIIVAGGSLGSKELPRHPKSTNTYNIIRICWNPKATQLRINVTTRGLVTFQKNGKSLPRQRWSWVTLSEYDESFFGYERLSSQSKFKPIEYPDTLDDIENYKKQKKDASRGCYPVYEIRPSFEEKNSYESTLWIEYDGESRLRPTNSIPVEVIWYIEKNSRAWIVEESQDHSFSIHLNYSVPLTMYVRMKFPDGHISYHEILLRMPNK